MTIALIQAFQPFRLFPTFSDSEMGLFLLGTLAPHSRGSPRHKWKDTPPLIRKFFYRKFRNASGSKRPSGLRCYQELHDANLLDCIAKICRAGVDKGCYGSSNDQNLEAKRHDVLFQALLSRTVSIAGKTEFFPYTVATIQAGLYRIAR